MALPPLPVFLFAPPPLFRVLLLIPLYPGQFPVSTMFFTNTLNTTSNKYNSGFFRLWGIQSQWTWGYALFLHLQITLKEKFLLEDAKEHDNKQFLYPLC